MTENGDNMHVEKEIIYGVFKFSIIVITLAHTHQPQDFNLFIYWSFTSDPQLQGDLQ